MRISVIIPVYNSEKYLPACVRSVMAQTYSDLEIILVNDGSTDRSLQICRAFERQDPRVMVIDKKNGGAGDARNAGLRHATCDYITFVDSDDEIRSDMCEVLMTNLVKSQADMSVCKELNCFDDARPVHRSAAVRERIIDDEKELLINFLHHREMRLGPCGRIYKRKILGEDPFPTGIICEDIYVIAHLCQKAGKVHFTDEPMYYYMHRPGSVTDVVYNEHFYDGIIIAEKINEELNSGEPSMQRAFGYFMMKAYYSAILRLATMRQHRDKLKIHKKGLRQYWFCVLPNRHVTIKEKICYAAVLISPVFYVKTKHLLGRLLEL